METLAVGDMADLTNTVSEHKILQKGFSLVITRLVKQIGTGGMGEVYLAHRQKT